MLRRPSRLYVIRYLASIGPFAEANLHTRTGVHARAFIILYDEIMQIPGACRKWSVTVEIRRRRFTHTSSGCCSLR